MVDQLQNKGLAKPREIYAEWLRIFAAFVVVFQHTVTSAWYDTPVDTPDFFALNFMNSLSRFGVGVFIMISGAFMLSPRYAHPPQKVLKHNLPKVIIPLVFWVIFYGIVDALCVGFKSDAGIGETVVNVVSAPVLLFTTPATHLWFLYAIAGLYLITPAVRVFTEHASKNMVLYVIAIFFTFGLVFPTVNHLLGKWYDFTLYKNIGIRGCTTFAGFYLTGFYIAHYGIGQKARRIVYAGAIISWAVAFFYSTYISLLRDAPNEYFFGNFRPTTFLMAVGVFCLFRQKFGDAIAGSADVPGSGAHSLSKDLNAPNMNARGASAARDMRVVAISGCMMGVYIIHPLFIRLFYGLKLTLLEPHPLLTVPLMTAIFFGISLGIVAACKKVPGLRKII